MPNEDQRGGSGNFSNDRDRAAEAGRKGGQSQQSQSAGDMRQQNYSHLSRVERCWPASEPLIARWRRSLGRRGCVCHRRDGHDLSIPSVRKVNNVDIY